MGYGRGRRGLRDAGPCLALVAAGSARTQLLDRRDLDGREVRAPGLREILTGAGLTHQLMAILCWVAANTIGESEIAFRLFSAVPFILGVVLVTSWLHTRVGALAGVLYLFLTTVSPLLLDISRQARGYGLAFCAMSVVVVAALEALRTGSPWAVGAMWLGGLVGAWTLPQAGVAVVATAVVLTFDRRTRLPAALGLGLVVAATAAWYIPHANGVRAISQYGPTACKSTTAWLLSPRRSIRRSFPRPAPVRHALVSGTECRVPLAAGARARRGRREEPVHASTGGGRRAARAPGRRHGGLPFGRPAPTSSRATSATSSPAPHACSRRAPQHAIGRLRRIALAIRTVVGPVIFVVATRPPRRRFVTLALDVSRYAARLASGRSSADDTSSRAAFDGPVIAHARTHGTSSLLPRRPVTDLASGDAARASLRLRRGPSSTSTSSTSPVGRRAVPGAQGSGSLPSGSTPAGERIDVWVIPRPDATERVRRSLRPLGRCRPAALSPAHPELRAHSRAELAASRFARRHRIRAPRRSVGGDVTRVSDQVITQIRFADETSTTSAP